MGKVDDMRRRREAQHQARAATARPAGTAAADAAAGSPAEVEGDVDADVEEAVADATAAEADSGVCSGCGKVKPMQRGLIANHQKGLGKYCVGSRKPPA